MDISQSETVRVDANELHEKVIVNGYCIGCGSCATLPGSPFKMVLNQNGFIQATFNKTIPVSSDTDFSNICPQYNNSSNEDGLAKEIFEANCKHDKSTGFYLSTYAGHVTESNYREVGGSGGMVTWLISQLFARNLIDGVLHVKASIPDQTDARLFKYEISTNLDEAKLGAKSRYYPVEMSQVIEIIKNNPLRYAVVGLPCFLKALRLLAKKDAIIKNSLKYHIGLVCGHLKSTQFAEMIAWESGVAPNQLSNINFRHKVEGSRANNYSVAVKGYGSPISIIKPVSDVYGYDWGVGLFKYEGCDYCDDVFSELADVTIGDAWLPDYIQDGRGSNVVVVRTPIFDEIINQAIIEQKVKLDKLSLSDTIASQAGGLRHRRDGLSYRLFLKDEAELWRPVKRVMASDAHLDSKNKKIFSARIALREQCISAFNAALEASDFKVFTNIMNPLLAKYYALYQPPFTRRLKTKLKSYLKFLLRPIFSSFKILLAKLF